jgi:hypothetical protein
MVKEIFFKIMYVLIGFFSGIYFACDFLSKNT